jgi:nucleoside 2-deoxyribosyltransferase
MKSVVLCGSKKFKTEMRDFAKQLKDMGVVVFEPNLTNFDWDKVPEEYFGFLAKGLTHDHLYKMRMADVIFIYNQNGYIGNGVTMEIGFAAALDKPIYALEEDKNEAVRGDVLFKEVIKTPEELFKKL